ncbi:MAG: DUF937 domain-containing protein [Oscillospiraceae bacterium]|nr:DUF937 domain-containing protein [Oscillospiraceae bacterium]
MDLNSLMGSLLSGDSIANLSQLSGASQKNVKDVLSSALPSILEGAVNQANDENTVEGFANALLTHAKDDTSDVASFMSNVDVEDGGKIIGHLLGSNKEAATQEAATRAGLSVGKTGIILALLAPMLMSLLGQQTQQTQQAQQVQQTQQPLQLQQQPQQSAASLLGGAGGLGGLFSGLLGGGASSSTSSGNAGGGLGSILMNLLK